MVGANYERELRDILRSENWIVFRSAGSHVADLIALKPTTHMIIEVKSTQDDVYYTSLSKESKEQFDLLNGYANQGFNVYYYVRFKGRKNTWQRWKLPLKSYPVFKYEDKNKP